MKITNECNMELMARYEDKYFDLQLTDPPYGVNLKYNTYNDSLENWYNLMSKWIPEAKRVSRMLVFPSCSINKLKWIYDNFPPDWIMAWDKGSQSHASHIGFNSWEPLLVYGKIKEVYFHDVLRINPKLNKGDFGHPCPKPVEWFSWFYSKLNKLESPKVLDSFMGSGSSAIAAHNYKLNYTACELDTDYYNAAMKRLKQHQAQLRLI